MGDMEQLSFWSAGAPASRSRLQVDEPGYKESRDSCSSIFEQFETSCERRAASTRGTSSGRTYPARLVPSAELHSGSYSRSWMNSGTVWRGEYSMRNSPEYATGRLVDSSGRSRNAAGASSLSEFLEARTPQRYSLSAKACEGIIRRAEKRGKDLPEMLRKALEQAIAGDSSSTREAEPGT